MAEMRIFKYCVLLSLVTYAKLCKWGDNKAHCDNWGSCSEPCGGGRQSRKCYSCVWSIAETKHQNCNEFCYNGVPYNSGCHCPRWRSGRCCQDCNHIYIPNCVSGRSSCGGSPDGIKCDLCVKPYYSVGYNRGCRECPRIEHCKTRHCTNTYNTVCEHCFDDNVFFQRTTHDTKCERLCAFNDHYCWPGTCGDGFTKNCQCAPGFKKVHSNLETKCQPDVLPVIETCETVIIGPNGEMKRAESSGNSTECKFLQDMYGNFNPVSIKIDTASTFTLNTSGLAEPRFIAKDTTLFGVTDHTVYTIKKSINQPDVNLNVNKLLEDHSKSTEAKTPFHSNLTKSISTTLKDGDFICIKYEAKGGGYFRSLDFRLSSPSPSSPIPYQKTTGAKEICYIYDNTPANHCYTVGKCPTEPIQLPDRVTKETLHEISFTGWFDPIPTGGTSKHASGIESYEIRVNEVVPSSSISKVDYTKNVFASKVNSSVTSMLLNLTSDDPRLYCITLEVKDVADNVQQSRRFMLYDNSSDLGIRSDKNLRVFSASIQTNFTWQTHHHDVCLSWKDRFYNQFYINNKFLNPIEPNDLISGVFEQSTGILPVSGTPNIYGITYTNISWTLNDQPQTTEIDVPDFLNQTFCKSFALHDGDTYTFQVRPVDIARNTLTENITVHIDRSSPHINNIWLEKDEHKTLFVHHMKDLSTMQLTFDALDPHSGIMHIEWTFGTYDTELATGVLKSSVLSKYVCPTTDKCYCPNVGNCEIMAYTIPLNKLVEANKHEGSHNRAYYFSIKATNNALLTNTEHIDILVDDSPPEAGVVYEGLLEEADIDYTSDDSFMVHWNGFIDHESGINSYRLGMAERCLGSNELYNRSFSGDFDYYEELLPTELSTRIPANFSGKRFISVMALNNAMSFSKPVCSDGIIRDVSPPQVLNVTIEHATWSESVFCHNGHAWLFHSSMIKASLKNHSECYNLCKDVPDELPLATVLPTKAIDNEDLMVSEFLCKNWRKYSNKTIIYLPNDHIVMTWDVEEGGSQVNDYQVGIGTDASSSETPDIVQYKSTNGRREYKRHHEGIGSNELFYIFLKSVNKAGLDKITVIGPVLIDETPPLNREVPKVEITEREVICGWENDTFFDMEQDEQINSIFFQLGHDGKNLPPIMQWKLEASKQCDDYSGGCFKVPLRRIQAQDTDLGLDFYFTLLIYNNAGHYLTLKTDPFRLPSRYPPGHAVVENIDPDKSDGEKVTNVHFTPNTLCVRWNGFKHHQEIHLEIGVGSSNVTDDIVPFAKINSSNEHCIYSRNITYNDIHFVILKATCSGGVTISSSNGVRIIDKASAVDALTIRIMNKCDPRVPLKHSIEVSNNSESSVSFHSDIGARFKLTFVDETDTLGQLRSSDGILRLERSDNESFISFVSFVENPVLLINTSSELALNSLRITCDPPQKYTTHPDKISTYWYYKDNFERNLTYEVTLKQVDNDNNNSIANDESIIASERGDHLYEYTIDGLNLSPSKWYIILVRQCTTARCLEASVSDMFQVDDVPPVGSVSATQTVSEGDCFNVTANWTPFASKSNISMYQWALFKGKRTYKAITPWNTAVADDNKRTYQISTCENLNLFTKSTLSVCVRALTITGLQGVECELIQRPYSVMDKKDVVYDFDPTSEAWPEIVEAISSFHLGELIGHIHENELDFGTTHTKVAGFMLYSTERNVTWYLMTSSRLPLRECDLDSSCVTSTTNNVGFVTFPNEVIAPNKLYYICARSEMVDIERELFTETLEKIERCSNGFVLDDTTPTTGELMVENTNGFITKTNGLAISWTVFTDNINATVFGFTNSMSNYKYAVGSCDTCYDIMPYVDNGLSLRALIPHLSVIDGTRLYIVVNGTDHAGNSATVASRMIVDTTAPTNGHVIIETGKPISRGIRYVSSKTVTIRLIGFKDLESGLQHFEVGIGSGIGLSDIRKSVVVHREGESITLDTIDLGFEDGRKYFINVKAVNRAGLYSPLVTKSFIVDKSPPSGGHVLDGWNEKEIDIDYQSDTHAIRGHWKGMTDIHSGVKHYMVGVGTEPFKDDIESFISVGQSESTEWNGTFAIGVKYYITVKACNGAGLCTTRTSDGVTLDTSAPIAGVVRVGSQDYHQKYHPRRSSVHIQWEGFNDPQSSIDRYETCIGTTPRACDVAPIKDCHLRSNIIYTGLNLPTETDMYATVIAYNRVGMNVSQSTDSFRIDDTPPVCSIKPEFDLEHTSFQGMVGKWEKSLLRVHWLFVDSESPVVKHDISLRTHHKGKTPVEHIRLGAEHNLTISLDGKDWFNNGEKYRLVVTSCNLAGLCTSAESAELLIDSTPPHLGGFRPPMTWTNVNDSDGNIYASVKLSWYGFSDKESGIGRYFISAGQTYGGTELSGGIVVVESSDVENDFSEKFNFTKPLLPNDFIILTLWAQNNVGLNSSVARVTVNALSSSDSRNIEELEGVLELEKHSCDAHYCDKTCTCAVVGRPCVDVHVNSTCTQLSALNTTANMPTVSVMAGFPGAEYNVTPTSACLSASWSIEQSNNSESSITRFEWSIGLFDQPVGEGVFDLKTERPWHDVGLQDRVVHCLPVNRTFLHGEKYIIYVKAWYSADVFAIFESNVITIDQTPPAVRKGRNVVDSDGNCNGDFDVVDSSDSVTACWSGVFSEQQSHISYYTISMGTWAHADDILQNVYIGLQTKFKLGNITLAHGTKYVFTVTAYNSLGLHKSVTSDGFLIDSEKPTAGVVYNTKSFRNTQYQSSEVPLSFSWHGFQDNFSGLQSYFVKVVNESNTTAFIDKTVDFVDIGMDIEYEFKNFNLKHGETYHGLVYAVDNAGHSSDIVKSNGVTIDNTQPVGYVCQQYNEVSFKTNSTAKGYETIVFRENLTEHTWYRIEGYLETDDSNVNVIVDIGRKSQDIPLTFHHDGTVEFSYNFFAKKSGFDDIIFQLNSKSEVAFTVSLHVCNDTLEDKDEAIVVRQLSHSVISVDLLVEDKESSLKKVSIGAGKTSGSYQLKALTRTDQTSHTGVIVADFVHDAPVYVTVVAENHAGLRSVYQSKPITIDHTAPKVTDVICRLKQRGEVDISNDTVVEISWKIEDKESVIKYCECSAGIDGAGQDTRVTWKAQSPSSCHTMDLHLKHGDIIAATVKCVNNVELATVQQVFSKPVSLEIPDATSATVAFFPQNMFSRRFTSNANAAEMVQSNVSAITFAWTGFSDVSGIENYEYRLLHEDDVFLDWKTSNGKNIVSEDKMKKQNGVYKAEVRAVNSGKYMSDVVSSSLLVHGQPPQLSGQSLSTVYREDILHINWKDVFRVNARIPVTYDLVVGTRRGFTDILDISGIDHHEYEVKIPKSTLISPHPEEIFIEISCTYVTGLQTSFFYQYKL